MSDNAQHTIDGFGIATLLVLVLGLIAAGCAGPVPLSVAIDQQDMDSYVRALNDENGDARRAFAEWMAAERDSTPEDVLARDAQISSTRNPLDAYRDAQAVSRGAVLYSLHCARCHGEDARGLGPSTLPEHPATSFHTFGKRLTSTLHRGAPRKWFRVIRDGTGDRVRYPEGEMTAMPAFGDEMTREQIWLVITYLQSLDVYAPDHSS